ncbi:FAST kinase domain-containing protein 3, mitochondrial isoform X1 [Vicugna pacos]|uniref:FAST kinase domain-containing protein 3, mitochondrial isoform X1 n=1 Tax=Vicugna pacos TaxID=30538 RepID=A0A6J0B0N5_VICPA
MALITLRRNLCHLSDFRIHGALAALRNQRVNHVHKIVQEHLCPWFCSLPPGPVRVRFRHAPCQKFHSENGNDLPPAGEPAFSQVHDWDRFEQNLKNEDEQISYRRLNNFTSSEEVLSFLSTLQTLPDAVAAGALKRICEVEKKGDFQRLPKEILENSIFQVVCDQLEQDPSNLSNATLATALQALTLSYVDPRSSLLLKLVAECQHRLGSVGLDVHSLCVLGESLIKLRGPDCSAVERIICLLQGKNLEAFTPEDVVTLYRILQMCPDSVHEHQAFLNKMNTFSLSVVSSLSPNLMSQMLTALVVLDQTQALPLVIKLGKHAVRHIPHFTNKELGKVLEAFIYFGHNDRFFTKALEQHVAPLCLTLDPEVLSAVMGYCGSKRILSKPILNAVAEAFVCQPEKFSPSQISELIEPFGKLNYLPPNASALFTKLENILLTHFSSFPPKTLLKLLHSCSLIECHPVNFMAKLFSPHFLQRLQGDEPYLDRLSLAQLTQLFLTSVLECPFYKGPKLLFKYQVKSFLTPCSSLETPVDFQLYKSVVIGLIDLLGARLYFASKVLTPYRYTIDVEIKLDGDGFVVPFTVDEDVHKRVALCIDGPKRFCLNSKHLLGKEATKQRHLRLLGYQVIQIPYYEIEMLKSRLELVEYLQRKLFSQNFGRHWYQE